MARGLDNGQIAAELLVPSNVTANKCVCVRPFDRGKARLVSKRQSMDKPARWIAFRKLPNRRRIVFSDGRIPASLHLSAVGSEPGSATNSRRAATYSWIRVSATSDSATASPSNTPGGFGLWELRSTEFRELSRDRSGSR